MNRYLFASLLIMSLAQTASSGLYDCKEAWSGVRYSTCDALCSITGARCTAIQILEQNCHFDPFSHCVDWDVSEGGVTQRRFWIIECVQHAVYCSCDGEVVSYDEDSIPGNECDNLAP